MQTVKRQAILWMRIWTKIRRRMSCVLNESTYQTPSIRASRRKKKKKGRWRFGLYVCVMSRGRRGLRRGEYLRSMHGRCAARASRDSAQLTRRTACSDIAVPNTLRSPRYGFGSQDVMHA